MINAHPTATNYLNGLKNITCLPSYSECCSILSVYFTNVWLEYLVTGFWLHSETLISSVTQLSLLDCPGCAKTFRESVFKEERGSNLGALSKSSSRCSCCQFSDGEYFLNSISGLAWVSSGSPEKLLLHHGACISQLNFLEGDIHEGSGL